MDDQSLKICNTDTNLDIDNIDNIDTDTNLDIDNVKTDTNTDGKNAVTTNSIRGLLIISLVLLGMQ